MNIHCVVTSTALLLVISVVSAQRSWDSAFGYHRHANYNWPIIQIPEPRPYIRVYNDDDFTRSLRRLHLFQPVEPMPPPQPVVYYQPRVHIEPEVYVEGHYPYAYNRYDERPFITRSMTTLSLSYRTKILPVLDYELNDRNEQNVADSQSSASDTVPEGVKNSGNEPKATKKSPPKNDTTDGTIDTSQDKAKTTKPKKEASEESEAEKKPATDKTKQPDTDQKVTKDGAVDDVKSKAADNKKKTTESEKDLAAKTDPTATKEAKAADDDAKDKTVPTKKSDDTATANADVPAG